MTFPRELQELQDEEVAEAFNGEVWHLEKRFTDGNFEFYWYAPGSLAEFKTFEDALEHAVEQELPTPPFWREWYGEDEDPDIGKKIPIYPHGQQKAREGDAADGAVEGEPGAAKALDGQTSDACGSSIFGDYLELVGRRFMRERFPNVRQSENLSSSHQKLSQKLSRQITERSQDLAAATLSYAPSWSTEEDSSSTTLVFGQAEAERLNTTAEAERLRKAAGETGYPLVLNMLLVDDGNSRRTHWQKDIEVLALSAVNNGSSKVDMIRSMSSSPFGAEPVWEGLQDSSFAFAGDAFQVILAALHPLTSVNLVIAPLAGCHELDKLMKQGIWSTDDQRGVHDLQVLERLLVTSADSEKPELANQLRRLTKLHSQNPEVLSQFVKISDLSEWSPEIAPFFPIVRMTDKRIEFSVLHMPANFLKDKQAWKLQVDMEHRFSVELFLSVADAAVSNCCLFKQAMCMKLPQWSDENLSKDWKCSHVAQQARCQFWRPHSGSLCMCGLKKHFESVGSDKVHFWKDLEKRIYKEYKRLEEEAWTLLAAWLAGANAAACLAHTSDTNSLFHVKTQHESLRKLWSNTALPYLHESRNVQVNFGYRRMGTDGTRRAVKAEKHLVVNFALADETWRFARLYLAFHANVKKVAEEPEVQRLVKLYKLSAEELCLRIQWRELYRLKISINSDSAGTGKNKKKNKTIEDFWQSPNEIKESVCHDLVIYEMDRVLEVMAKRLKELGQPDIRFPRCERHSVARQ